MSETETTILYRWRVPAVHPRFGQAEANRPGTRPVGAPPNAAKLHSGQRFHGGTDVQAIAAIAPAWHRDYQVVVRQS